MTKFFATIIFLLAISVFFLPYGADALTVSPVRSEVEGDPGGTVRGELLLLNEQEGTRTFYSSFANFEATGETGTPNFIEGTEGLATWIETSSQVTLQQGEGEKVPYAIKIPVNADPGGHFAAIFWSTSPPATKGGGVSIGAKIGALILLRVSGEIQEGGGPLEFSVKDKQKFFSSLPITLAYRFSNAGGDRVVPQGEITIKNLLGLTSATLPANKKEGSVLPNSIRKFEVAWAGKQQETSDKQQDEGAGFFEVAGRQWSEFHFGWYTAKMSLVWGAANQTASSAYSFFIIPWQLLLIVIIILAIIGFLGRVGLKKYNRWIIAKATQQKK